MSEPLAPRPRRPTLAEEVGAKESRKLRARRRRGGVWFGLGVFGIVGWSVAIPMLAGIALGMLLDERAPRTFSWTLALLLAGLALGCLNAWYWVSQEGREIRRERESGGPTP
jgi:ATP synthase protein I